MTAVFSFKHKGQQSSPQTVTIAAEFRVIDLLKETNVVFSFTKERGCAIEK